MVDPYCVLGEALVGRMQEFGRHLEVTLGRLDIEVTKVSRKLRQQSLDVLAGAVPCNHAMNGRCVAKIMQARRARFADRALDTGGAAHMLEHGDDARIGPTSSTARGEQR